MKAKDLESENEDLKKQLTEIKTKNTQLSSSSSSSSSIKRGRTESVILLTDLMSDANLTHNQYEKVAERLGVYMNRFSKKEEELYRIKDLYAGQKEDSVRLQTQCDGFKRELKKTLEEMEGKDKIISSLKSQLGDAHGGRKGGERGGEREREVIERLREKIQAEEWQVSLLGRQLREERIGFDSQLEAKDETIEDIRSELRQIRGDYKKLREIQVLGMGGSPGDLEQLEEVKKELFFTLGLIIKTSLAQVGKFSNLNTIDLYDEAKDMDYRQWRNWLGDRYRQSIGELPRGYTTLHTPDHSPSPSSSSPSSSSRFSSSPSPSSYRQNGSLGVAVEKVERRTPKKTKRVKKRTAVIDAPEE